MMASHILPPEVQRSTQHRVGQKPGFFIKKTSPVSLTVLNRVLMGFMGKTGENSDSLHRFGTEEPNLENQKIILQKTNNDAS